MGPEVIIPTAILSRNDEVARAHERRFLPVTPRLPRGVVIAYVGALEGAIVRVVTLPGGLYPDSDTIRVHSDKVRMQVGLRPGQGWLDFDEKVQDMVDALEADHDGINRDLDPVRSYYLLAQQYVANLAAQSQDPSSFLEKLLSSESQQDTVR